ncbi:zinc-dependent peptidase [Tenacibaculum tangerinum]|uniref:Zinc-dependent peptidase n=1 Tax=Tenacibaculum tangerinum TaxID=3038772 RepID=A0ABY8L1K9_9FLAO|nr:zinc-dependent peptidase [Tenacibaculum tangerinum]WGH75171.1 zinc-dependent peptidase [Tenacibaculum tangerinum]
MLHKLCWSYKVDMRPLFLIKYTAVFLSFVGVGINIIESFYVYFFNKPVFVHFYPIKKKLPKNKKVFLAESVAFYQKLTKKQKVYFEHRLAKFIRKYDFIERGNFEITPEMKVLIAASYIKLTFGMRKYLTSTFDKIIIYPTSFYSPITKLYHKGEFNPGLKTIVFSWEDFLLGDIVLNDNVNLGIHEFSHALTFHGRKSKDVSARIYHRLFEEITSFMDNSTNTETIRASGYFRDYALTNKLEFVAVIMEHFFETPEDLQQQFPQLYQKIQLMLNYSVV